MIPQRNISLNPTQSGIEQRLREISGGGQGWFVAKDPHVLPRSTREPSRS